MTIDEPFERRVSALVHEVLDREMGPDPEWPGSPAERRIAERLADRGSRRVLRLLAVAALLVVGSGVVGLGLVGSPQPAPRLPGDGVIAFLSPIDEFGPTALNLVSPNGADARQLVRLTAAGSVAFSTDGERLAIRRSTDVNATTPEHFTLAVLDATTGAELDAHTIPRPIGLNLGNDPRWSFDGRGLLTETYTAASGRGWPGWAADTWQLALETGTWTHLTRLADGPALWSPDGSWLLVPVHGDLYLVGPEALSGDPIQDPAAVPGSRRLTEDRGWKYLPSWSPDSSRVMWIGEASGGTAFDSNGRIEILEIGTGARTTLAEPGCAPTWSPDGRSVAYLTGRRGTDMGFDAWISAADGSEVRRLGTSWSGLIWSPSGSQVLLDRNDGLAVAPSDASGPGVIVSPPEGWYSAATLEWRSIEIICRETGPLSGVDWQPIP